MPRILASGNAHDKKKRLHIAACGHFDAEGGRFWVLKQGLIEHGYTMSEHNTKKRGLFAKYRDLFAQLRTMPVPDSILAPFLSHYLVPLLWIYCRYHKIPLVVDAFLSLYDTEVHDRRRVRSWSVWGRALWMTDWLVCRLADIVLIDTPEHAEYFINMFNVSPKKILPLSIGCRTDIFRPSKNYAPRTTDFIVEFHGTFIPLQGVDTIIRAAKIIKDQDPHIHFRLIGHGQTSSDMEALAQKLCLTNITFVGSLPMNRIPIEICHADACLGIFGTTDKASRVIPNKAYEILHCGKPLITRKSSATERVLHNEENALLVEAGNPEALTNAILRLKKDSLLADRIGKNGRALALEKFIPKAIVRPLAEWLGHS